MKATTLPILAAALLLAAAPALAVQPERAGAMHVASADGDYPVTSYLNKAQLQYDGWYRKMADLRLRMGRKESAMSAAAKGELESAWNDVRRSWAALETTNNRDWDSARAAWAKAEADMASTWQRVVAEKS